MIDHRWCGLVQAASGQWPQGESSYTCITRQLKTSGFFKSPKEELSTQSIAHKGTVISFIRFNFSGRDPYSF